jgi:mono/diheme cytochrome c family protein
MRLIAGLLEFLIAALVVVLITVFLVMPLMQWNASTRPSSAESWVASYVVRNWVRVNASSQRNPMPPTPKNLRDGEREYDQHCAVCHGIGGNAQNLIGADFYPPIAQLNKDLSGLPDGALYFIVSNGIRMTAMPGFGTRHSAGELWKMILWVRHLPHLTPQERAAIQSRIENSEPAEITH